jgi:N-methylhydantoinase B
VTHVEETVQGRRRTATDAFTNEVIRTSLVSITREMKTNLMRAAYTAQIYEAEDFTVGLFDADGNTLSIGLGLPMFIRGLSDSIKAKIAHWGKENIAPGDILLTNDPDIMGSHLNHMIFTTPVFHDGELMAFSSSMGHWQDVGGVLGGITQDIYSEGIQVPLVKIFKAGVQDDELTEMIAMNCRSSDDAMGDMRAQIAAIRTGERRLRDLLRRYGNDAFRESIRLMFDQSERVARAEVASIPDGVYEAEAFMDDDGVVIGKHIPIAVKVIVSGDQMTIDLSGVGAQVAGYFNAGITAGRSAAEVAFKFLTTPTLYPINDGAFRALNVVLPPGRVISASRPAPVRRWMTVPMTVVDTVFKALAPACPERVLAGHHADLNGSGAFGFISSSTGGLRPGTKQGVNAAGGGWGAKFDEDGMSVTKCLNDGDTHNTPVEAGENRAPIIIVERSMRIDSGGPGKFRGGLGLYQQQETRVPALYHAMVERTQCAPWGLLGGKPGLANRIGVVRKDGTVERFPSGKVEPLTLAAGDGWISELGGGGGFWSPLERDPEAVLRDVRLGYVSIGSARDDYGIVVSQHDRRFELDEAATADLRARLQAEEP